MRRCPRAAEQGERLVLRRQEAASSPEGGGLLVERVHDQGPAEGQPRARDAAHERVLEQAGPDALAAAGTIGRELAEQQAGDRSGAWPVRTLRGRTEATTALGARP
jgi:hypothetical protein